MRPDAAIRPGGDTIQLQKTKEALERLGVQVQVGEPVGELLTQADIVHVFNAQTPEISLPALQKARAAGKKTALSTIWWNPAHAQLAERISQYSLSPNIFWALCSPLLSWMQSQHSTPNWTID